MKHRVALYLLLVATLCMGCGGSLSMRQLEQLEARMNDAPDSAPTVLTATDMPRWGEARALYALLTVQAQDKSYIDVADDSLIRVATHYYDRRGPALRRLQAFYYHGRVYANAGLSHEAMTAYTRAEEFVDEVDALLHLNMLQYSQADSLFNEVLVWSEAYRDSYVISSTLTPLLRLYDATANVRALDSLLMRYPIDVLPQNAATYGIIAHY